MLDQLYFYELESYNSAIIRRHFRPYTPVFIEKTLRLADTGAVTGSQPVPSTFPWTLHFYFPLAPQNVQNVQLLNLMNSILGMDYVY